MDDAGVYTVSVRNTFGSAVSTPIQLNEPDLPWTTSSNGWKDQTNVVKFGTHAAQSPIMKERGSSSIYVRVTGPGRGSFWWKSRTSSEDEFVEFLIDGENQDLSLMGDTDWIQEVFSLDSEEHILEWRYVARNELPSEDGTAWLDLISFIPTAPAFGEAKLLNFSRIEATVNGEPGTSYRVQMSLDLQTWAELPELGSVTAGQTLILTNSQSTPRQFYRLTK